MSGGQSAASPKPQGNQVNVEREHGSNNPHVQLSPVPPGGPHPPPNYAAQSGWTNNGSKDRICDVINKCGKKFDEAAKKAEVIADNVWNHLRTNPSITDAAMARLTQGTRVLTEGGWEKVFQRTFDYLPGEKLLKSYACYLSTTTGPVIGTLYLSTKRLAFCSDHPLCYYLPNGQQQWMYYKLAVPLDNLNGANPSANRLDPSAKYIQILTREGHEYWFMGFISYEKALKNISEALQQYRNQSAGNSPRV
ncbi:hypothetical protein MLD38_015733 [Melastoma candidum]|uniref:Uncharacterized protein n=1 Tax=Melastoma candidum TaxID=119954 RepID=A0ACB9RH79_9MYRT|nr:hypothetical protein MLD38_015733 [Melastoma candidum]